jgi:hypothetical protein
MEPKQLLDVIEDYLKGARTGAIHLRDLHRSGNGQALHAGRLQAFDETLRLVGCLRRAYEPEPEGVAPCLVLALGHSYTPEE